MMRDPNPKRSSITRRELLGITAAGGLAALGAGYFIKRAPLPVKAFKIPDNLDPTAQQRYETAAQTLDTAIRNTSEDLLAVRKHFTSLDMHKFQDGINIDVKPPSNMSKGYFRMALRSNPSKRHTLPHAPQLVKAILSIHALDEEHAPETGGKTSSLDFDNIGAQLVNAYLEISKDKLPDVEGFRKAVSMSMSSILTAYMRFKEPKASRLRQLEEITYPDFHILGTKSYLSLRITMENPSLPDAPERVTRHAFSSGFSRS